MPQSSTGLLYQATGRRHPVVAEPAVVPTTLCDLEGVWHASVAGELRSHPPAGGAGLTRQAAETAALGEALERYAAALARLPRKTRSRLDPDQLLPVERFSLFSRAQRQAVGFPHPLVYQPDLDYTVAYSLLDNSLRWAPAFLVGLEGAPHGLATSSGLAAGSSKMRALLRALQELVERDALMITWHHGLGGRRVELAERWLRPVRKLGGRAEVFDLTPAYSPHPVAVVAGNVARRGAGRFAIGAACRSRWEDAVDKAFLEWAQGILFAGVVLEQDLAASLRSPRDVRTFEDHAAYYTRNPDLWPQIPLLSRAVNGPAPDDSPHAGSSTAAQLEELVHGLAGSGASLYYRDLTTADLRQIGVTVVRVLSPDLAPIHADERWPFLGGTVPDLSWRYPGARGSCFPNPLPHPLG